MRRIFLDWNRPALAGAAEYLRKDRASQGAWPLEQVIVVVPGRRAGRRFLEILVQLAEEHSLALSPPRITTAGALPELLYDAPQRFAGPLACHLAWIAALRETDVERLRRVIPELPPHDHPPAWSALADLFGQLHGELTAHGLRFADVAERGFDSGTFDERPRWQTMDAVQRAYERRLHETGLADMQSARLAAIAAGHCRVEGEIVLLGVADANQALLNMLVPLKDRVTALVHAPAALANRFTEWGTVVPEAWLEAPIELDPGQIVVVEGPADQAEAAVAAIAGYEGRYGAEDIAIGVPDPGVVPYLEQRLEQFDLPSRYADGLPMRQSGPYRLLTAAADYLESGAFADLARLVRHPDVERWLADGKATNCLNELDRYYSEHLQSKLTARLLGGRHAARGLADIQRRLDRLLGPLGGRGSLVEWAPKIAGVLIEIYGQPDAAPPRTDARIAFEACQLLHRVLVEAVSLDERMAADWRAPEAIRLFQRPVESEPIPPLPEHAAIELLGWLELPLDDAPALIVTGFNDGLTPTHVSADLFLPGALRHRLKLNDNDRRYARDAYALSALAASRERLTLIAGRRTAESDPLSPSRLLFACDRPT
ncbi:MAG TPA: hypothetical protein VN699_16785, partial [Pirellulales bacterium]|nr:hypothetical protein [Pirellulales bacterium]